MYIHILFFNIKLSKQFALLPSNETLKKNYVSLMYLVLVLNITVKR